jgi:hypothetical protein
MQALAIVDFYFKHLLLLQRTYGEWWNAAPSRTHPFMPQSLGKIMSQDYIGMMHINTEYYSLI